jgi:hypothetical protein
MSRSTRYSLELRERAVRMVNDNGQDYRSECAAFTAISSCSAGRGDTQAWVRKAKSTSVLALGSPPMSELGSRNSNVRIRTCVGPTPY